MKALPWLVVFVLLLVAGSLTVPATVAQGPTYWAYLPLLHVPPATPPPPVHVLPNYLTYQTTWGSLHILGEVENTTADAVGLIEVIADFYDSNHHLVANDYTYLQMMILWPGDKSCFELVVSPTPSYASFEFEPPSYSTYSSLTNRPLNLTLVDPSASYSSSTGDYQIIGLVRNDGAVRVELVRVVGTLYNAAGTVVGCDWTYVNNNDLDPGQFSSFTLGFSGLNEADMPSWRLQMFGWQQ